MNYQGTFYPHLILCLFAVVSVQGEINNSADQAPLIAGLDGTSDSSPLAAVDPLDTIIVTAARREQAAQWISDDHSLINVENSREFTSKNSAELIATKVPGWISDYGSGGLKNISLRGAGSERTLILVDGKRVGTNENDIGDIPSNIIKKIEIVEGGQSALYGMDAIGGVVNIITKRPLSEKPFVDLSATTSSFEPQGGHPHLNAQHYDLSSGFKREGISSLTSGNWQSSDGRYSYPGLDGSGTMREHNGFSDWGLYQKIGYEHDGLSATASGSYCDRDIQSPGSLELPSDLAVTRKKIGFGALDGGWKASEVLQLKVNISASYENLVYNDPNPSWPQKSDHFLGNQSLALIQEFSHGRQSLTTGAEFLRQTVESNEIGNHAAVQGGVFASGVLQQTFSSWTIREAPSVRFDYSTIFNSAVAGKLGIIAGGDYPLSPSLFVNLGNSFRSPTFKDLFWPKSDYMAGNPDLKAEHGLSGDAGMQVRHSWSILEVSGRGSLFMMRLRDMIIWGPDQNGFWSPHNVESGIDGLNLGVSMKYAKSWDTDIKFSRNNAKNLKNDSVLIYRPKYCLTGSVLRSGCGLSTGASCRYTSKVFTNPENTGTLPPSMVLDANIGYKILSIGSGSEGVRLVYDILNVLDEKRMTNQGYPLPGREHRLSMKVSF
jgi:vitamin B12 transporter